MPRSPGNRESVDSKSEVVRQAIRSLTFEAGGLAPTRREIADETGFPLTNVQEYLCVLRDRGEVAWHDKLPRSIHLTVSNEDAEKPYEFYRCIVGSQLTGLNTADSDTDIMGVCLEPARDVIGFGNFEQYTFRDQPEGKTSKPGDTEGTIYSLRKWMYLAAVKGNPTVLALLFVPKKLRVIDTPLARELCELRPAILSRKAGKQFLGYLNGQKQRMVGEKRGRVARRELPDGMSYDPKYAAHMVRLGFQGVELLTTGKLQHPLPDDARGICWGIRSGNWELGDVLALTEELEADIEGLLTTSMLPPEPDMKAVNKFLYEAYTKWWSA